MHIEKKTSTLLVQWYRGDHTSLQSLLKDHLPWVRTEVRKRIGPKLRGKAETNDFVQDAMIEFLTYGPRIVIEDDRQFRGLLLKIVENNLRDKHEWFNAKRRAISREMPLPSDTVLHLDGPKARLRTPSQEAQKHEEEALLRLGMELVKPQDREVLVLRQWEGKTFLEISQQLGISEEAAWERHSRAVRRLAKEVGRLRQGDFMELMNDEEGRRKGVSE